MYYKDNIVKISRVIYIIYIYILQKKLSNQTVMKKQSKTMMLVIV